MPTRGTRGRANTPTRVTPAHEKGRRWVVQATEPRGRKPNEHVETGHEPLWRRRRRSSRPRCPAGRQGRPRSPSGWRRAGLDRSPRRRDGRETPPRAPLAPRSLLGRKTLVGFVGGSPSADTDPSQAGSVRWSTRLAPSLSGGIGPPIRPPRPVEARPRRPLRPCVPASRSSTSRDAGPSPRGLRDGLWDRRGTDCYVRFLRSVSERGRWGRRGRVRTEPHGSSAVQIRAPRLQKPAGRAAQRPTGGVRGTARGRRNLSLAVK